MAKKKKSSKWLYILIGVVILLIIIALFFKKKSNAISVRVQEAETRTIVEKVSASGKIYPEVELIIVPEISGEIISLFIEEGDSVLKGEPLAKINPDIYQDAVERAEASVFTAKANLGNMNARKAQAKASFEQAKLDYNRNKKLYDDNVISQAEWEAAEAAYNIANAELDAATESVNSASYTVKSAEATYREAKNSLNKTTVYAPMTGIVSSLSVEEGKVVGGIAQLAVTEMMRIANLDEMEARVEVSENDILRIQIGDTAEIEVEAYDDRIFLGIVSQISSSANQQLSSEQATNFTVKIRMLKESYADIMDVSANRFPFLPGMSTSVEIITDRARNALSIPIESVTTREKKATTDSLGTKESDKDEEEIREIVFVLDGEKVREQEVSSEIQDDRYIHISKGLEPGDKVVYYPYSVVHRTLKDGDAVSVEAESNKKE